MKRMSFALAPALAHSAGAPAVSRFLLGAAALVAATVVLLPEDASAQWRGGWRGPGWGGGYGGYYRPWAGPLAYTFAAPIVAVAPYVVLPPVSYSYAPPYPSYGGGYYGGGYGGGYYGGGYYAGAYYGGGYYGYRRCFTDEGYGRYLGCDR